MIKNYLLTALRNIKQNSFFSFINSLGLSVGIAITIFIVSWIIDEISYDKFHVNGEKIFRIERKFNYKDFNREIPVTSGPYGQKLVETFPEVINATRLYPLEAMLADKQNIFRKNDVFFADGGALQMFTFSFIKGDTLALMEPNTVVLTSESANKLLGSNDIIGNSIKMNLYGRDYDLKITGIIESIPSNSHFHPKVLISISTLYPVFQPYFNDWRENFIYTYIELANTDDNIKLQEQFPKFLETNVGPIYSNLLEEGDNINDMFKLKLKRLTDIHLHSQLEFELEKNGNLNLVYIFGAVAFLILLIASINFVNLSTAKGETRSLEVGIRKVSGAQKKQLVLQFIFESLIIAFVSFVIALVFVEILSPFYTDITGKNFDWIFFSKFKFFALLLGVVFLTGLLAGVYPAFFLSRFNPVIVLKAGKKSVSKKFSFRTILVVFQFFISVSFVILSVLIFYQLDYIQNKDIGYSKENILIIPVDSEELYTGYESFREELLANPTVFNSVSSASVLTTSHMYETASLRKQGEDDSHFIIFMNINYGLIETLQLNMLAGRSFLPEYSDTSHSRFIINETTLNNLGWKNPEDAIGEPIDFITNTGDNDQKGEIIGVVKNFHFKSLHQKIEPLVFQLVPEHLSYIYIRLHDEKEQEAISYINRLWLKKFPEAEFNYFFLSDELNSQYNSEQQLKNKLMISTILAIFIACLGLLGLSVFLTRQKTKEIGIRKVMGASVSSIVRLLSVNYLKWIIISTILAWPVSYLIMNKWLNGFSAKINLLSYWWVFLLSGLLAAVLSLLVVSIQTIKFATINPARSLKYE